MKLEELVYRVESRLFLLGRMLLQADEKSELREELEFAQDELAARQSELAEAAARRDALRQEILAHQAAVNALPEQIRDSSRRGKSSQALRQALELERIRRELDAARKELPRLEQTIWSLCFHLRQKRRDVARMRERSRPRR